MAGATGDEDEISLEKPLRAPTGRGDAFCEVDPALQGLIGRAPTTLVAYAREHARVWMRP